LGLGHGVLLGATESEMPGVWLVGRWRWPLVTMRRTEERDGGFGLLYLLRLLGERGGFC
jgi:hypothetical protein